MEETYLKQWRQNKRAKGLCQSCGIEPLMVGSTTKCNDCSDLQRTAKKTLYHDRIKKNQCTRCGKDELYTNTKCSSCASDDVLYKKRNHVKLKYEVIGHYGGICVCCGESWLEFLTLDHTNNDGAKHRLKLKTWEATGIGFYKWVKRNGFPNDLQVLCWQCNCGKNFNGGICPHRVRNDLVLNLLPH